METPNDDSLYPQYAASDQPVTRGIRFAWTVWVLAFLGALVMGLLLYLFDKFF
ncbi:MAG: hypothetical protein N2112_15000 [Gemmataceae bacterium]|jgi:hypothetical protein|nr:hypothetical protein [Gemmataceae bacterium]